MVLRQLFKHWTLKVFAPGKLLRRKYEAFKELLRHDKRSLELITDLEDILHGARLVDWARVESLVRALTWSTGCLVRSLVTMHPNAYRDLEDRFREIESSLVRAVALPEGDAGPPYTVTLTEAARAPELAGGKASTLSQVLQETGLPGPRGFVVTTNAFRHLLDHNDLRHRLDELLAQIEIADWLRLTELSREMTAWVQKAAIPPAVSLEIARRLEELRQQGVDGPWALRSSALSEDGEASFAGQYTSLLDVAIPEVWEAYKQVLASKYSPPALAYRIRNGLADQETPMAVLFLEMIHAVMSGVVYTQSPEAIDPADACVEVFAQIGLGRRLVDGGSLPEIHYLSREVDPKPLRRPSDANNQRGGVARLASETALRLARWGMKIEEMAGRPQDIEWCQDNQGNLYLLQSRPLDVSPTCPADGGADPESLEIANPILLEGGVTASAGLGMGQVSMVRGVDDLASVPEGAVLVSPTLPPAFAAIIQRLRAAVADQGSRASHFAMVAREYGLPVIVAARDATRLLPPGRTVTVDAGQCRVYLGEVESLKTRDNPPTARVPTTVFFTRLRNLMELVSPLRLTDPSSPGFSPHGCQSLHDLVRFAHEKGMAEMFSLVGRHGRGLAQARRLDTDLPLVMYVLDLGGGISPEAGHDTVSPWAIISEPMRACWQGLTHPDVTWHKGLLHIDWEELDRISSGLFSLRSPALASYAIISKDYHHLILRFGYHFAVLDALCGADPEANYIAFRFKGGGGSFENRLRRIQLIQTILEWAGFAVQTRGDLLDARFQRRDARRILSRLTLLGLLQGKTLLLDMALDSDEQVIRLAEDFMQRYREYVADELY